MDELVLGWLVRIQLSDYTEIDRLESEDALGKLNKRRPEWVAQMRTFTRNETRRALRERGLSSSSFPNGEVYIVTVPDELFAAQQRYATKLGKALYYMHTGRIVPADAHIQAVASTNEAFLSPQFPWPDMNVFHGRPVVSRRGRSLEDQFAYRYALVTEAGGAGAFVVQFRESTVMTVAIFEDAAEFRRRSDLRKKGGAG